MGKKVKIGKARKDKFYHLAKETGYRSRAAFKLLQLNRKYKFLEKARVCIDLCAAPGGWLQVASQHMPISSLIIGVDLVSIKPIHNAVSFQEDITTEKCRQTLKRELQTWKADVVLNDGAPNVGKNWVHDAFQQAELTLEALKLATQFLKKGGWFITKVFRSKDYHSLIWVFNQLFKKVYATKPQASRNESAEIFVICQSFKAPDTLDPRFTDPKHVFKEVHLDGKTPLNLIHPEKHIRHREGYDENDTAFFNKLNVSTYLTADNHLELLCSTNQIVLDNRTVAEHVLTTPEIKACCKDIKVLGKKELRSLIAWRKKMQEALEEEKKEKDKEDAGGEDSESAEDNDEEDMEDEEEKISEEISRLTEEKQKDAKRKRKKVMKEKRKLRDKMALKMVHPGDRIEVTDDISLFDLKKIKTKQGLNKVQQRDVMEEEEEEDIEQALFEQKVMMSYDRHGNKPDYLLDDSGEEDDEEEGESEDDSEEDEQKGDEDEEEDDVADDVEEEQNPLVTDLESQDGRVQSKMAMWYSKDAFEGLEDEEDEDMEIEKMTEEYQKKGGIILEKPVSKKKKATNDSDDSGNVSDSDLEECASAKPGSTRDASDVSLDESDDESDEDGDTGGPHDDEDSDDTDSDDDSGDDGDFDVDESLHRTLVEQQRGDKTNRKEKQTVTNKASKDGFEIVSSEPNQKVLKLDPVELAIGEELVKSKKRRREIIDMSYNRYTQGDEDLPDWFVKEETKHSRKQLPVTKEQINLYKEKLKAIDVRPIKKIAQAKARKKRKMTKKLERARKKAEVMSDSAEMSEREKWKNIKDIYKKAGLLRKQKKELSYVVAKKGGGGKTTRPDGVKGKYRVVDPRMKKDNMVRKKKEKETRKKSRSKTKRK